MEQPSTPSSTDAHDGLQLRLESTKRGTVRITWTAVPVELLEMDAYVDVFHKSDPTNPLFTHLLQHQWSGCKDTKVPLTDGLQLRLMGTEASTVRVTPTTTLHSSFGADDIHLTLYGKNGKACARLELKKGVTDWTKELNNSWVGIYGSPDDRAQKYKAYEWVSKFSRTPERDSDEYNVYEYDSGKKSYPGVQARFFLQRDITSLSAMTGPLVRRTLFTTPEFDETNGVPPTPLRGFEASLQLFVTDGHASARLYIQKNFADWREIFRRAWVAFYSDPSKKDSSYGKDQWQWVSKFHRNESKETSEVLVYEYKSMLKIAPGVQARFFLRKDCSTLKASTVPWTGIFMTPEFAEANEEFPTMLRGSVQLSSMSRGLSFADL